MHQDFEEFTDRLREQRMDESRVELREWTEHELPEMHFRMRNRERRGVDDLQAPQQDVQVYEPGAIAKTRFSPHLFFYSFQLLQQFAGAQCGMNRAHLIEELWLVRVSPRARLVYG